MSVKVFNEPWQFQNALEKWDVDTLELAEKRGDPFPWRFAFDNNPPDNWEDGWGELKVIEIRDPTEEETATVAALMRMREEKV